MKPWENVKTRNEQRWLALELFEAGLTGDEVAERLRIHPRTLWRWLSEHRKNGWTMTRHPPQRGRPRQLDSTERDQFQILLLRHPQGLGFESGPWTIRKVRRALFMKFNLLYRERSILWIMKYLGWKYSARRFYKIQRGRSSAPKPKSQ